MDVKLIRAEMKDAERLWKMQIEAFQDMYLRYGDTETNPACEPIERVIERFKQASTYYYFILSDSAVAGAIRVVDPKEDNTPKRISPIFVMPPFRNRGIAQRAILEAENLHGNTNWELGTILQEEGNCHLYEKMGYRKTGKTKVVNDKMTLVFYQKD